MHAPDVRRRDYARGGGSSGTRTGVGGASSGLAAARIAMPIAVAGRTGALGSTHGAQLAMVAQVPSAHGRSHPSGAELPLAGASCPADAGDACDIDPPSRLAGSPSASCATHAALLPASVSWTSRRIERRAAKRRYTGHLGVDERAARPRGAVRQISWCTKSGSQPVGHVRRPCRGFPHPATSRPRTCSQEAYGTSGGEHGWMLLLREPRLPVQLRVRERAVLRELHLRRDRGGE